MSHKVIIYTVSDADIDQLFAKLVEKNWERTSNVLGLRRHLKDYGLFRRILSSLWLIAIYLAVGKLGMQEVLIKLQEAGEIGRKQPTLVLSKYLRAGRTAWDVISKHGPGVLAVADLSIPTSRTTLDNLLGQTELRTNGAPYRRHIQEVFDYLREFLEKKQKSLFELFSPFLEKVRKVFTETDQPEAPAASDVRGSAVSQSGRLPLPFETPSQFLPPSKNRQQTPTAGQNRVGQNEEIPCSNHELYLEAISTNDGNRALRKAIKTPLPLHENSNARSNTIWSAVALQDSNSDERLIARYEDQGGMQAVPNQYENRPNPIQSNTQLPGLSYVLGSIGLTSDWYKRRSDYLEAGGQVLHFDPHPDVWPHRQSDYFGDGSNMANKDG